MITYYNLIENSTNNNNVFKYLFISNYLSRFLCLIYVEISDSLTN